MASGQGNEGTRGVGGNQHGESTDRAGGLGVSNIIFSGQGKFAY